MYCLHKVKVMIRRNVGKLTRAFRSCPRCTAVLVVDALQEELATTCWATMCMVLLS